MLWSIRRICPLHHGSNVLSTCHLTWASLGQSQKADCIFGSRLLSYSSIRLSKANDNNSEGASQKVTSASSPASPSPPSQQHTLPAKSDTKPLSPTHKPKNKKPDKWNLPSIESFIEQGVLEVIDNAPRTSAASKEPVSPRNEQHTKRPANISPRKQARLFEKQEKYQNVLDQVKDTSREHIFSKLDDKALSVLKRRPELENMLLTALERDNLIESEEPTQNDDKNQHRNARVPKDWRKDKTLPEWQRQVYALREKFQGQKWSPRKKLSREAMEGIRVLKSYDPLLNAGDFARMLKISPESVRRILKSNWEPKEEEMDKIAQRWQRRGSRVKEELRKERKEQRLKELEEREQEKALESKNYTAPQKDKKKISKRKPKNKTKSKPRYDDQPNDSYDDTDSPKDIGNQVF